MLPMTTLQFSDLATFESDLNTANLVPQDATEPQVGFAELLGLNAGPPREATLPAGLGLPAGGNPLPAAPAPGALPAPLPAIADSVPVTAGPLAGTQAAALPAIPGAEPGPRTTVATLPTVTIAPQTPGQPAPQPAALPLTEMPVTGSQAPAATNQAAVPPGAHTIDVARATTRPVKDFNIAPTKIPPLIRAPAESVSTTAPPPLPVAPDTAAEAIVPAGRDLENLRQSLRAGRTLPPTPADTPIRRRVDGPLTELSPTARPLPAVALTPTSQVQVPQTPVTLDSVDVPTAQLTPTTTTSLSSARPVVDMPAPTGVPADRIDAPVRDANWGEQLGQRLQMMASNRLQTAEIRLSPAELGPLRVQVAMEDGAANVTFQAQHAVTREAIEQALPRLREMLAENGVQLNQADIGDQGVRQGDRQSDQDSRGAQLGQADSPADAEIDESGMGTPRQRAADGLVDTFA